MTAIRVALAGLGIIGRQHLRLVGESAEFELVGIADPSPDAATLAPGDVPVFEDFRTMIAQTSPSAVIVATPNHTHGDIALHCLERGMPVLIEKPIAATLPEAAAIVEAVEGTGVPALIGHHRRHSPDMVAAREMVLGGELGDLVSVTGLWMTRKPDDYFSTAWRVGPGGGPVMINLIHEIDCLRFLVGEIDQVYAVTSNKARTLSVEDTAAVCIRFANGTVGTVTISDATPSPWLWDTASGQGAGFPYQHGDCYFLGGTTASVSLPSLRKYWHAPHEDWRQPLLSTTVRAGRADCYREQLDHFAQVVRGEVTPACSAEDGYRTLAATLAVSEAAASGVAVTIPDLTARAL
ncbi:Gfo/Idh/MocA family protein [Rhodococcus opacus]|uniref:Gfo/Idh/MocA family protein n=1 Tax=Rhodococcus opacus TaxID=37919 RepID=UPI001C445071|nr:Gfo/Idh/MocA family oxidoreductase [Rhodococcus opacus]MBV6760246.1 Gfo/Idh/MocA family oxidoreductase [Rhodococcus opacus]